LEENAETGNLICVIEARSNTMKMGYHQQTLADSLASADRVVWFHSESTQLDLDAIGREAQTAFTSYGSTQEIIDDVVREAAAGDHVVVMSNGGFEGLHQRLGDALAARRRQA